MNAHDLLQTVGIVPLLPLFGAVLLLCFGKRIGEPLAGWIATGLMGSRSSGRSSCSRRR